MKWALSPFLSIYSQYKSPSVCGSVCPLWSSATRAWNLFFMGTLYVHSQALLLHRPNLFCLPFHEVLFYYFILILLVNIYDAQSFWGKSSELCKLCISKGQCQVKVTVFFLLFMAMVILSASPEQFSVSCIPSDAILIPIRI